MEKILELALMALKVMLIFEGCWIVCILVWSIFVMALPISLAIKIAVILASFVFLSSFLLGLLERRSRDVL